MEVEHTGARSGISWPPQPGALVDTGRCPSCFTAITVSPCPACGLDLTDARTARVLDLSQRIVALVDERAEALLLIHRVSEGAASSPVRATEAERHPVRPAPAPAPALVSAVAPAEAPAAAVFPPPGSTTDIAAPPSPRPPVPAAPGVPRTSATPVAAAPADVHVPPGDEPPAVGSTTADPAKPRRSSVQVFLLSTGVVLLAVAAVFFLTVAWISGGLVLRSVIIGLVTAAVIATASLLRRRRLEATAEGISLLGIALVALDVWAVRANDLGGAASLDAAVYWGAATTAAGAAFVGWSRLSRLRAPLSTAVVALAVGPAILAAGVVGSDTLLAWYVSGLVVVVLAIAAPVAPLLGRPPRAPLRPEIAVVRAVAGLAAIVALAAALFLDPESTWAPVLPSAVLALALAAHAWTMTRRGESRLAPVAAIAAVLSLGAGVAVAVVRAADATLTVTVPVVVAAVVALTLDVAGRRAAPGLSRTTFAAGAITALAVAGLASLAPVGAATGAVFVQLSGVVPVFGRSAFDVRHPDAEATAAVIALAAVVALAAIAWRLTGAWGSRRLAALAAGAAIALLAGPQLRVLLLVVAWYLALALTAVVVLLRRRGVLTREGTTPVGAAFSPVPGGTAAVPPPRADAPRAVGHPDATAAIAPGPVPIAPAPAAPTPGAEPMVPADPGATPLESAVPSAAPVVAGGVVLAVITGTIALLGGWVLSFASPLAWGVSTVVVTGVIAVAAGVHRSVRVASTAGVVAFVSASALLLPSALRAGIEVSLAGGAPAASAGVVAAGCLLFLVSPLARRVRLDVTQRAAGALTATIGAGLSIGVALLTAPPAADAWIAGAGLAAVVATIALAGAPSLATWRIVRPAAALTAPLFAAATTDTVLRLAGATASARTIAAAALGVVVAGVALRALRSEPAVRALTDAGTAVVLVLAVAAAPSEGLRWVPLLLAAVAVLLWATDSEGLFSSSGARRHLVWLALAVGAAALWSRLLWQGTDTVEFFTLPVGVALLSLAAGTERARRRRPERSAVTPAVIAAAGTGVALLPTALADPDDLVRAVVAGGLALVALLAGAWVRPARTPDVLPVGVAAAGALTLVLCVAVRVTRAVDLGAAGSAAPDAALVTAALAFAVAAVGLSRRATTWAAPASRGVAIAAVAVLALGEAVLVAAAVGPVFRVVTAIAVLGAAGVVLLRRHLGAGDPTVAEMSVGGAALGGAALVAAAATAGGMRPIEWATIPLALVALATALLRWSRPRPEPLPTPLPFVVTAAVGLAVGLLPSAVLAGDSPARAIGVALAAAIVLGTAPRLLSGPRTVLLVPSVAISGAALAIATALRAVHDVRAASFDLWLVVLVVVLMGAAVLLARRRTGVPVWMPPALAVSALALATGLSAVRLIAVPGQDVVRVVVTLAVVFAVGVLWRGPRAALVRWTALGLGLALAIVAVAVGAADPVETATLPLAAALLVHGIRSLRSTPELGSWPALGAGLGVLLVPSLLFDFSGDSALWRVIGLGAAALVALLWGVRRRLQAPVVLGGVVLIVHAVAQLWPWITALYESASGLWWLWLGIAGALLIVVAATYERRIREVKAVALALRALR